MYSWVISSYSTLIGLCLSEYTLCTCCLATDFSGSLGRFVKLLFYVSTSSLIIFQCPKLAELWSESPKLCPTTVFCLDFHLSVTGFEKCLQAESQGNSDCLLCFCWCVAQYLNRAISCIFFKTLSCFQWR